MWCLMAENLNFVGFWCRIQSVWYCALLIVDAQCIVDDSGMAGDACLSMHDESFDGKNRDTKGRNVTIAIVEAVCKVCGYGLRGSLYV